jgi:hypothetical protein
MHRGNQLSESGLAFLKCAFASPDFSVDPGKGIPDTFQGRTLALKDCFTTSLEFTAATDTYIIQAPVPGYAYFVGSAAIGSLPASYTGVPFPTYETNFGATGASSTNNFSKFRYASMASGIYPTSNMMQFAGSIQVWRIDLNLAEALHSPLAAIVVGSSGITSSSVSVVYKRIQGLQGITTLAPRDNYSDSFIKGAYTYAFDKTTNFEWEDFCGADAYRQGEVAGTGVALGPQLEYDGTHKLTGLGNVNTLVYKISTPTGAVNSAMFRAWNCIELQPDTNSSLFQFSGMSPNLDPLAIELYHKLKMTFPVAMPCSENSKFWEVVLRSIQRLGAFGSYLPGPAGVISGGVGSIAGALHGLII